MMLRQMARARAGAGAGAALAAALAGLAGLPGAASAADTPARAPAPTRIRVILVGDSTMASRNGYGDALCARFTPDVACLNLAKNGRSSRTFREEGRWAEVEQLL